MARPSAPRLILVLGGARSGKSTFAERLAATAGSRVTYLATAQAFDDEMRARITAHRAARPRQWVTVECPLDPATAIRTTAAPADCFLLDCLTLLVSNLLLAHAEDAEAAVSAVIADLLAAYCERATTLILVSNEVGQGLVPDSPLGRRYRDLLGKVNQHLARNADHVYWMVAGLPVDLKALAASTLDTEYTS